MDSTVNPGPDSRFGNEATVSGNSFPDTVSGNSYSLAGENSAGEKKKRRAAVSKWKAVVAEYQEPNKWRANWQVFNTIGGYVGLWFLMYWSLSVSWWLTVPLAIFAGGLLIRAFIIFHDCGHGSFYKSPKANSFWGYITGVLVFTPYQHWTWEHSIHHQTSGHLENRGVGDVWTMTVKEYLEASRMKKFFYRLLRDPFVLFVISPIFLFVFWQRVTSPKAGFRKRISVWLTNLGMVGMAWALISIFGFIPWLIIQSIAITVAACCGVWLFYVQHQFEDTYWASGNEWDYTAAALKGSSFYKLPRILQWFSGNIGFHHIHHLSPKIPNYNLEKCHHSDPMFADVVTLTLLGSLKSLTCHLWDEDSKKLISFRKLRQRSREALAVHQPIETPGNWEKFIAEAE